MTPEQMLDVAVDEARARGIEVVDDPERAIREQLFQLDEVVAHAEWLEEHADLLGEYQPQARLVQMV